jgi:hypothetical protein
MIECIRENQAVIRGERQIKRIVQAGFECQRSIPGITGIASSSYDADGPLGAGLRVVHADYPP